MRKLPKRATKRFRRDRNYPQKKAKMQQRESLHSQLAPLASSSPTNRTNPRPALTNNNNKGYQPSSSYETKKPRVSDQCHLTPLVAERGLLITEERSSYAN